MLENYDQSVDFHNTNWPFIPDHPYRILIIDGSGSGKSNVFTNLIVSYRTTKYWQNLLNVKDPFESKYQLLINGREKVGIEKLTNTKAFIDYS